MTRTGARAASIAASIRAPRSPSPWRVSVTASRAAMSCKAGCRSSGVTHNVTGPISAAQAVAAARAINRACRTAAPLAPRTETRRVFAKPGSGAFASTATATASLIAVLPCQRSRIGAEEVGQAQAPHQKHGPDHAIGLPAPARCDDAFAQAQGPARALETLAQGDVLHQRDCGKSPGRLERVAPHENRLIPGRDPGEPRADIHECRDDGEQRIAAIDLDVETAP